MKVLFVTSRYPTAQRPGESPCIAQQKESLERLGHTIDVLYINALQSKLAYASAFLKLIVKAQVLPPVCVTVNVCPAIVSVPLRVAVLLFAATR